MVGHCGGQSETEEKKHRLKKKNAKDVGPSGIVLNELSNISRGNKKKGGKGKKERQFKGKDGNLIATGSKDRNRDRTKKTINDHDQGREEKRTVNPESVGKRV